VVGLGGGRIHSPRESRGSRSRRSRASAQPFVGHAGAEPPLSPIALPTSREVDCAEFDPAPHLLRRQDASQRYGFDAIAERVPMTKIARAAGLSSERVRQITDDAHGL
jgi:hypothetical protein